MVFIKSFPLAVKGTSVPKWIEIALSEREEEDIEKKARIVNGRILQECIVDAQRLVLEQKLKNYQTDVMHIAIALFEKRASHVIYWKEEKAREKFEQQFPAR